MASQAPIETTATPDGFGSALRDLAPFPVIMGGYAIFYAVWWPLAWGWAGAAAFLALVVATALLIRRGVSQLRHAALFPDHPTPAIEKERRSMMVLNSFTHPIWMIAAVVLLLLGHGRWVLPVMVFVIGVHFLPMARILGRKIDYLLGPITMLAAIVAGILAVDPQVSWLVVFAVAGTGGAVATLSYAFYLAREYRQVCDRAGASFPSAPSARPSGAR